MSIRVMTHVWTHSKQKGAALLLLLAIADFANDDGEAWPAVETLAEKIRMSERYTHMLIKALVETGELAVDTQAGKHGCNLFLVQGVKPASPVKPIAPGVKPASEGGEARFPKGVKPASPEPSLTIIEPKDVMTLTPAATFYFQTFNRKRWANAAQAELFASLETEMGDELLTRAVKWAAEKGISDLHAIRSAAKKMATGPKQTAPVKPVATGGGPWGARPSVPVRSNGK